MLRYTEFGLSHLEVPDETSLCIYISGCQNNCRNCHYPELQSADSGEVLSQYYADIVALYESLSSCVCFMGEGDFSEQNRQEIIDYVKYIKSRGLKSCLYSGRDVYVENWMNIFDYVKTGSYKEEFRPLSEKTTNQHFYQMINGEIKDITEKFWE